MKPLVDGIYLLQKFPGKGGWTYAAIPEILQDKNKPFGWVVVRGSVDGFELKQYKLMPMGEGRLFLPVKAQIRKKIKKEAGDQVHIILYADDSDLMVPQDILDCFANESPHLLQTFKEFTAGEQKTYIDWILAAKTEPTKIKRIVEMMERLQLQLRLQDPWPTQESDE